MKRVAKASLKSLGFITAIPVLGAILAIVRLKRQAEYFDIFEMAVVITLLAGIWFSFRQFTRKVDDITDVDEWRRLVLPAWRIAVSGALGLMFAIQIAMRHLR